MDNLIEDAMDFAVEHPWVSLAIIIMTLPVWLTMLVALVITARISRRTL